MCVCVCVCVCVGCFNLVLFLLNYFNNSHQTYFLGKLYCKEMTY